eukprot:TRINITY_DN5796_c0_g1_i2.p2 TRINITY_DN5796_c0_g1~~TRINITY_DN5796_c0_g1_i2.p2  ORF type:complete len:290 (-),score=24.33 TRINITY_DN5796_c0_g1_i2:148-1017(-)
MKQADIEVKKTNASFLQSIFQAFEQIINTSFEIMQCFSQIFENQLPMIEQLKDGSIKLNLNATTLAAENNQLMTAFSKRQEIFQQLEKNLILKIKTYDEFSKIFVFLIADLKRPDIGLIKNNQFRFLTTHHQLLEFVSPDNLEQVSKLITELQLFVNNSKTSARDPNSKTLKTISTQLSEIADNLRQMFMIDQKISSLMEMNQLDIEQYETITAEIGAQQLDEWNKIFQQFSQAFQTYFQDKEKVKFQKSSFYLSFIKQDCSFSDDQNEFLKTLVGIFKNEMTLQGLPV